MQIRNNESYTGGETIIFTEGECTYTVTNTGGENRQINITSIANTAQNKQQIIIDDISPQINITSWKEILDF